MKTIILLAIMAILFMGYNVADKASNLVQGIKTQQVQQLALLSK